MAALASPPTLPTDVRLMRLATQLLLALGVVALLAGAAAWLAKSPWFALRHIRVEGEVQHNSAATLRSLALPALQGSYLSIDLQAARAAFEAVPWVRRAQVQRVFPDRLVVRLEEHQAVAFWQRDDSDDLLVNQHGEVFEANIGDVEDEPLPILRGPEGSAPRVLAMWQRLNPEFAPLQTRLKTLVLSNGGSWRGVLESGTQLELGRGEPEEVLPRTRRFLATVGQVRARHEMRAIESADLRHREGYALRLAGMGSAEEAASAARP